MDAEFESELQSLLARGRKIEAIKRYREAFDVGLDEAKQAVESLEFGFDLPKTGGSVPEELEAEIVTLLERGEKIEAIKVHREKCGTGLKEAKEAVEAIAAKHGIESATGSGCLGVALFALAIVEAATRLI